MFTTALKNSVTLAPLALLSANSVFAVPSVPAVKCSALCIVMAPNQASGETLGEIESQIFAAGERSQAWRELKKDCADLAENAGYARTQSLLVKALTSIGAHRHAQSASGSQSSFSGQSSSASSRYRNSQFTRFGKN
ncbi:MAG: hypothetical protein EOP09_13940, partial [Proteobacteria bacterium]